MNEQHHSISNRMFIVFGLLLLIPFALILQLLRINFWAGHDLRTLWSDQTIGTISIPAKRGNIYDDKGRLLATNSVAYHAAIDPHLPGITRAQINKVSKTLALYTPHSSGYYQHKILSASRQSRYVMLAKNIPAAAYDSLQALHNRAVILGKKYQRVYNFGSLAAHTLGYVGFAIRGQTGLEKEYNRQLKGTDGKQQVRRNRLGQISAYLGAPKMQPKEGYSLYTTLDMHIQAILQEALKRGVEKSKSNYGTAIVLNTRTGAVKAIANYPTFNPNHLSTLSSNNQINHAIADEIEPGSTFKLVTAIAAVETHKVNLTEEIKTAKSGKILIHGQWMRDHEPLGTLTFPQCIQESSNICVSEVAMRLSNDTFYQYARNLGFGTPTGIDLPNEASGKLKKPYKWTKVTLPWMSVGYSVQVTPIQLAQAYAAFANNGIMMEPFIVKKIVDGRGNVIMNRKPVKVRRVAKKETIKELKPVFEGVVSDSGTAPKAHVKGLPIAGKTGTAQEYINGRYRHIYRGLFVGFFPVKQPKYVCLVVMDKPHVYPYFGGWVAAPVFHNVAKRIAGLDPDIEQKIINDTRADTVWARMPDLKGLPTADAKAMLRNMGLAFIVKGAGQRIISQKPAKDAILQKGEKVTLIQASSIAGVDTSNAIKKVTIVPNVIGMSMREAAALMNKRDFNVRFIGSGTIYKQYPKAGARIKPGKTVLIRGKRSSLENTTAE
jgi:cell division protein FtsI (penicillin-binding protein 3)